MNTKVIKRDGTLEQFSSKKIRRVVVAAGLNEEQANTLITNLETWINSLSKESVTSLEIRDKVLYEMNSLDPYAANMYAWYQKTKDKR